MTKDQYRAGPDTCRKLFEVLGAHRITSKSDRGGDDRYTVTFCNVAIRPEKVDLIADLLKATDEDLVLWRTLWSERNQ